jgi:hypothetical protein
MPTDEYLSLQIAPCYRSQAVLVTPASGYRRHARTKHRLLTVSRLAQAGRLESPPKPSLKISIPSNRRSGDVLATTSFIEQPGETPLWLWNAVGDLVEEDSLPGVGIVELFLVTAAQKLLTLLTRSIWLLLGLARNILGKNSGETLDGRPLLGGRDRSSGSGPLTFALEGGDSLPSRQAGGGTEVRQPASLKPVPCGRVAAKTAADILPGGEPGRLEALTNNTPARNLEGYMSRVG